MKNNPRGDVFYHRILRWPVLFALALMLVASSALAKGPIISTGQGDKGTKTHKGPIISTGLEERNLSHVKK